MSFLFRRVRAIFLAFLLLMASPSGHSFPVNTTTVMPMLESDTTGGGELNSTTSAFLGAFAASVVLPVLAWAKDTVSEKDFALKVGAFFAGVWQGFSQTMQNHSATLRKQAAIETLLSDKMTRGMNRLLKASMEAGLKEKALFGDDAHKFKPGYFFESEYFVWQDYFPSRDSGWRTRAPGMVIYVSEGSGDFVPIKELRPLSDKTGVAQGYMLTKQLLSVLLPDQVEQNVLLDGSLKQLQEWFLQGHVRGSLYLGGDTEAHKIPESIKVLRVVNPLSNEGTLPLLGTLIFLPDIEGLDFSAPLLEKPAQMEEGAWRESLPPSVQWFFEKKSRSFFSRDIRMDAQGFVDDPQEASVPSQVNLPGRRAEERPHTVIDFTTVETSDEESDDGDLDDLSVSAFRTPTNQSPVSEEDIEGFGDLRSD